jgi:hypothetical protein
VSIVILQILYGTNTFAVKNTAAAATAANQKRASYATINLATQSPNQSIFFVLLRYTAAK